MGCNLGVGVLIGRFRKSIFVAWPPSGKRMWNSCLLSITVDRLRLTHIDEAGIELACRRPGQACMSSSEPASITCL